MTIIVFAATLSMYFSVSSIPPQDLDARTAELSSYCRARGYNTEYGILVDYGRNSLMKRFYIVDLKTGEIVFRSLCGHGRGGNSNLLKGEFSNKSGSWCSSLGHYKIGRERMMYNLPWMAFEMDGLDSTNSNARARAILLHKGYIPLSNGCIIVPWTRYGKLSEFIHSQSRGMILWAYE